MNETGGDMPKGEARDAVAEVTAREWELLASVNSTMFIIDPKVNMEFYAAEEIREFDLMAPMEMLGQDFVDHMQRIAPDYIGHLEIHNLRVDADGDVGFSSMVQSYRGIDRVSGKPFALTFRMTHGWKRIGGKWKLVHEHLSLPIDMESGKAHMALDYPPKGH